MIFFALALLATQDRPAASTPPAGTERWSILTPDPGNCPKSTTQEIIVCAPDQAANAVHRLPLPDERVPDGPAPANPNLTARRALELEGTPCAATQRGCQVGFGPPIVPMIVGAVGLLKGALAKKPDKRGRVAIPLEDPVPVVLP